MGGLGLPAAVYLASAGVGTIGIVDNDVVEMSNLQRQFLFSETDLGKRKVEVAKERLGQINPNVRVVGYDTRLDSGNALDVIGEYELVIDATDNLPSRYLINDACVLLGKPDVYASVMGFDGQASVFYAPQGPCYRCLYPKPPPPDSVKSCEDAGVLGVIPGILGGLQANQAVILLTGKGSPFIGRLIVFNGFENSFDEVRIKKDGACPVCGPNPTVTSLIDYEEFCGQPGNASKPAFDIAPIELSASIGTDKDLVLLDVREPYEYSMCHLDNAKLIPLGELPRRTAELDKDRPMVVYCHVGVRSTSAVAFLRGSGFTRVRNLQGGIDAWAVQVDKMMRRY
jgi:adenylyltransferase/sulfurtransferase